MEFTKDGKECVIRGDTIKTILHGAVHSLQKLMANGVTMFMMQMVKVADSLPLNAIVGEKTRVRALVDGISANFPSSYHLITILKPRSSNQLGAQRRTYQCTSLPISPC